MLHEHGRNFAHSYDGEIPDRRLTQRPHEETHPVEESQTPDPTKEHTDSSKTIEQNQPPRTKLTQLESGENVQSYVLPEFDKIRKTLSREQQRIFDEAHDDANFHQQLSSRLFQLQHATNPNQYKEGHIGFRGDINEYFLIRSARGDTLPIQLTKDYFQHKNIRAILPWGHGKTDSFAIEQEQGIRWAVGGVETTSHIYQYEQWWKIPEDQLDKKGRQLKRLDEHEYVKRMFADPSLPSSWFQYVEQSLDPLLPNSSGPLIYRPGPAQLILPGRASGELTPQLLHGEVHRSPFSRSDLYDVRKALEYDLHIRNQTMANFQALAEMAAD